MSVCQICGDRGYSKLLICCLQCQSVAVHRYCVVGPAIFYDEGFKWSCEDCVPGNTKPSSPVLRLTTQNRVRKERRKNLCAPQVQNLSGALKETAKKATDPSIVDQQNKGESVKGKQAKLKEHRNPVIRHVSDATDIILNELNSDNFKKGSSEAVQVTGQKIKNVNSFDRTGLEQVKLVKNVGSLLCKVEDHVKERKCMAGGGTQGEPMLSKEQNLKDLSLPRQEDHIDENLFNDDEGGHEATDLNKSSCEIHPEIFEEMHIKKNFSQDSDQADHADTKKSVVVEQTASDFSERQAPRKRRRLVIEMEYSDEEPVFVVAKRPQLVADVDKDPLCKSSSEALSMLSDDGLAQLSSVESVPLRPSPMKVDDHVLSREPSVVLDNHGLAQPLPVNLVKYVPARPLIHSAWSGCCRIRDDEYSLPLVLEAHLSNKAHENVQGAVLTLPELLNFDFVPKKYAWPKSFEKLSISGDLIGLYFFPVDESGEKLYEYAVDKMIDNGLALKSLINNLELLVFCSRELPQEEWSIRRKYYLWGVFKPRKDTIMPNNLSDLHISNGQSPMPSEYPCDGIYHPKDTGTTRAINTSLCPSNLVNNIHVHQEDARLPDEPTRPISSKPLKRPHDKRGYICHQKDSKNCHVSCREDYRHSRKFWKPQDREHHRDAEFSGYDREHSGRWKRHSSKRKDRGFKDSRHSHKRYYSHKRY